MPTQVKPQTIFVVDDESTIAQTLATILRKEGFRARSFSDPNTALDVAKADAPDLLITDITMPTMTGVELSKQMRRVCPRCRVLLFSGIATLGELVATVRTTGSHFDLLLSKPIHPKDLLDKVEQVLTLTMFSPPK
jgi:DNA-binding NtrC family response regulator